NSDIEIPVAFHNDVPGFARLPTVIVVLPFAMDGNAQPVEDHRAIKRRTRPMLGFKDFHSARVILGGIEVMHMIRKGQMKCVGKDPLSASRKFYSLVM
ncbi:transposase, partial [Paraburkholderia tuberum]